MLTKLEFETPEGRLSLPIDDVQFMAYDAGEVALRSMPQFVCRMRAMGLGEIAETHARLLAQNKVHILELREARDDAQTLLACGAIGETMEDTITPRLDVLRESIAQTHAQMRRSVERLAALSAACHHALNQIPGYSPPPRPGY
ncbi:hypothetical protein [Caballeronia sp. Lep1P3]|uniref:hypothetical protein n=1 Tax=Caballeronia sp. Lep1P3 TaxID=2878150 RepID=UPI001FCFECE9|nr:hypothetical protein [Caballeronia sp. Lep1P3]